MVIPVMEFQVRGYKIIKVLAFKFYDDMVYKLPNFSFQKSDFEVFP